MSAKAGPFYEWWKRVSWTSPFVDPCFAASQAWLEREKEVERLRDLIRTAHDNADYIVSMLKSDSEAVTVWPQTRHAILLLKAEAIMALEDEMRQPTTWPT